MKISFKPYSLEFKHAFGVHGHTRLRTDSVFVKIESDGVFGYGEACLPAYLGENLDATLEFLALCEPLLQKMDGALTVGEVLRFVDAISTNNNAGKAAIDIALNDVAAKKANKTFREFAGLAKSPSKATSHTIGIDTEEKTIQKLEEATDFKILKVKLGTTKDKQLIEFIRKHSKKPLYVDVNQGWTNKEFALDMLCWLNEQQVVLAEQPLPVAMKNEMEWLTHRSPIPTIADESVKRLIDLKQLDGAFSGVNIKLMKCTGLHEALEMILYCKEQGLKVMLGCMAESSCATSAMAQLVSLADFVDLDAPMLYKNDPFKGITYSKGNIQLNVLPGMGAEPIAQLF